MASEAPLDDWPMALEVGRIANDMETLKVRLEANKKGLHENDRRREICR